MLYDNVNIAAWLMPLVYAEHVSQVVWLKPPWCSQIPDGRHVLTVGKRRADGRLGVHSSPVRTTVRQYDVQRAACSVHLLVVRTTVRVLMGSCVKGTSVRGRCRLSGALVPTTDDTCLHLVFPDDCVILSLHFSW